MTTSLAPEVRRNVEASFQQSSFLQELGVELVDCGPGWVEARIRPTARHLQHGGVVHAGVTTTLADHAAGAATMTLAPPNGYVVSIEIKMVFMRPAKLPELLCRARVLKAGKRVNFVEAEVTQAGPEGAPELVAKLLGTMHVSVPE